MRVMTLNLQSGRPNESWNEADPYFKLDERLAGGRARHSPDAGTDGGTGKEAGASAGAGGAANIEASAGTETGAAEARTKAESHTEADPRAGALPGGDEESQRIAEGLEALRQAGVQTGAFLALASSAAKVAGVGPDVLAMQEVRETLQQSMIESFASYCGMPHTRFAAARRAHSQFLMKVRGRERIGYGIALLSRYPIEASAALRLPSWRNPVRRDPKRKRGIAGFYFRTEEQRRAILALVRVPEPVVVAAAHLTARKEQNLRQLEYLERKMRQFAAKHGVPDAPQLLLGDLNLRLDKVRQATSFDVLAEAATFPEHKPTTQIDHVLGRGLRSAGPAEVVHLPIADHLGLVTQVVPA